MLRRKVSTARIGNDSASCCQVSRPSRHWTGLGGCLRVWLAGAPGGFIVTGPSLVSRPRNNSVKTSFIGMPSFDPVRSRRLTNLALLWLLAVAFATGWVAFELSGQPARAVLVLHASAGVGMVLLVPWKSLIARRGLGRRRPMRWASVVLAFGVVASLAFGFLHSAGRHDIGYLS